MTSQGKKKKQVCRCYTVPFNKYFQKLEKSDMSRDHLKCCICLMKKVGKKGSISKFSSRKGARQALKHAVEVFAGESRTRNLCRNPFSVSKISPQWHVTYIAVRFQISVAKKFSKSSAKFVVKSTGKGKGCEINSLPECNYGERQNSLGGAETSADKEDTSRQIPSLGEVASISVKDDDQSTKVSFRSFSIIQRELPESNIGWPLLRKKSSLNQEALKARKARNRSLIEWISSLPCRVSQLISNNQKDSNTSRTTMSSENGEDNSVVDDSIIERTDSQLSDNFHNKINGSCNGEEESSFLQEESSSMTEDSIKSRLGWPLLRIKNPSSSDSLDKYGADDISSLNQSTNETKEQTDSDCNAAESSLEETTCFLETKHCKAWLIHSEMLQKKLELVVRLNSCGCNLFTYEELKLATNEFSAENLIGEGGCSNVYKGQLPDGKAIAVKVLKQYKEAWDDFSLEVDIMSSLQHEHIAPLLGVCNEDENLILVHDFLIGGSLEEKLQERNQKSVLPWKLRFKVAVAIAEALNYLHNNSSKRVIHRDVKSSNILLSKDYQPQLSDFGLAIWRSEDSTYDTESDLVGTFGYIAPEYFMHGLVSEKIDVYSYGVVLLELLTGKKPISSGSRRRKQSLVHWATPLLESGNLEGFLDPKLKGKMNISQMHKVVLAATLCIKQNPRLRPNMNQVLKLLKGKEDEKKWFNSYITDLKENSQREINGCQPNFSSFRTTRQSRLKLKDYLKEEQD